MMSSNLGRAPNPPTPFPTREGGASGVDASAPPPLIQRGEPACSPFPCREGGRGVRCPSRPESRVPARLLQSTATAHSSNLRTPRARSPDGVSPPMRSLGLLLLLPALGRADDPAAKVRDILKTHCHRCHGDGGSVEGGMNYLLDLDRLVARKKLVPGKPDQSPVFKRVAAGTMPPPDVAKRPAPDEVAALKKWIEDGAPGAVSGVSRKLISPADVNAFVLADLEKIDRRSRRFVRYFSFAHLHDAGLSDDELQTYRNALAKLVNCLSWHPKVRNPEPIDADKTVFRIDLRWFVWDATTLEPRPPRLPLRRPRRLRHGPRRDRLDGDARAGRPRRLVRGHRLAAAAVPRHPATAGRPGRTRTPAPRRCRPGHFPGAGAARRLQRLRHRQEQPRPRTPRRRPRLLLADLRLRGSAARTSSTAAAKPPTGATSSPTRSGRATSRTSSSTPAAKPSSACPTACKATS